MINIIVFRYWTFNIFNFRSKTVSEDENTTSKDMTLADKLINVSIRYLYNFTVDLKFMWNIMLKQSGLLLL